MVLDEAGAVADCMSAFGSAERELLKVARAAPAQRSATLARVIEADVIPRLMLARGLQPTPPTTRRALEVHEQDIDDFAAMMVALDLRRANVIVASAIESGVDLETILLDLLAPTAQRLGQMWVDDEMTFTDVTVGLCSLQNVMRSLAAGDLAEPKTMIDGRVLVAATPGEQHTFGVLVLETLFRRAGWDTVGMPLADSDEICAAVSRRDFVIVGFSLARESALDELARLIRDVRAASRNETLTVMVGGRVFNDDPGLARRIGADLTARDGREALIASNNVVCSRVKTH